ncbi:ATP-binding protein [Bordetella petrii]|uniref:ATP-binding protein n=1 Tax=Bordetella petrii TaxID=94624 RepID=UPI001E40DB8A|nr:ATP-binding protein [Bordetella petrii]MCD0501803.1 GAF domain-containing protein [Bordetella petrii]
MNTSPPAAPAVTLANCDSEPIHIPGAIQPHGALLAFDAGLGLRYASANAAVALGMALPLDGSCTPADLPPNLADGLAFHPADPDPAPESFVATLHGMRYDVITHRNDHGYRIVELERCQDDPAALNSALNRVYRSAEPLRRQRTVEGLLAMAVREVRQATGFDRVMAYRFHPDDSGEIVCEARRADLENWEGRRYPAADIPVQARRLYIINTLRLIADATYTPVPLLASQPAGEPLDLSHSVLRSVSPVHLEYMANMGVRASMSLSLVIDGRLWGMIACHHLAPRHVPYSVRMACEILTQVLSASIASCEGAHRATTASRNAALVSRLGSRATSQENMHSALAAGPETPAELLPADAALCLWSNSVTVFSGIAPRGTLTGILATLDQTGQRLVHTQSILQDFPNLHTDLVPYAGLLACKFDPLNNGWLVWLRKEQMETVVWGGKPEKQYTVGAMGVRLTPRGSFDAWREVVRDTSTPWLAAEIEAADNLRDELSHIATTRAVDIDRARTALLAMLGHDLRDPLQSISMAATLLSRTDSGAKMGERIRSSSGRMQRLISQVLDLSRLQSGLGLGVTLKEIDLAALARDLIDEKRQAYPGLQIDAAFDPDLRVQADIDRIAQVLTNLLSNARHHGTPRYPISVEARRTGGRVTVRVVNHGQPIPEEVMPHLFMPFKPESVGQARNRSGLGLGLYIADQIVAEHGGTLCVHCADGLVAFTFTIPTGTAG